MRSIRLAALSVVLLGLMAASARADYPFSSSQPYLVAPSETWTWSYDQGNDWGSPGVGAGTVPYGESSPAYGMEVTFTGGGPILPGSIALGNASACTGSSGGGTTFCTISPTDIWEAFQTGPDSIEFLAQNSSYYLSTGQDYFVNVFFTPGTSTPTAFTGAWLTSFTPTPTPEPSSLLLLGTGLVGLFGAAKRKLLA